MKEFIFGIVVLACFALIVCVAMLSDKAKPQTYMEYQGDSITIYNAGPNKDTTVTISDSLTFKEFFNQ